MKLQLSKSPRRTRISLQAKLIAITVVTVIAVALTVGVSVSIAGARKNSDRLRTRTTPLPIPSAPASGTVWQPTVNTTWQIVLQTAIELNMTSESVTPDVAVFDIDLFGNSNDTIDALHKLGKKVICYFSAGSYEPYRPDSGDFSAQDKGKEMNGWPDERWLNINSANVRKIMSMRLEYAAQKGCDGVDPDNVDGYQNDNGLRLTKADTINYVQFLASTARSLNLAIGLKNAADIVPDVLPAVQFAVNEQCVNFQECGLFSPFIDTDKPVFHIEYPEEVDGAVAQYLCAESNLANGAAGFSTVLKNRDLDGWVKYCDGQIKDTVLVTYGNA